MQQPGTLRFVPAAGVTSVFTGAINTTGPIIQDGPGTTILSGSCSYPTGLTIASGTLGLRDVVNPTLLAGNFTLSGGTLEFNTVSTDTEYTGAVSGSGGLNKSGSKKLTLSGSTGNTYNGDTNILGGSVDLNKTSGYAIPGNLNFSPVTGAIFVRLLEDHQIAPSATVNFYGTGAQFLELLGHSLTVAGLSDSPGLAFVENSHSETGDYPTAVLTIDSAANSVFNGCLRDNDGTGTGKLALVKNGSGTLTLARNRCGLYTGGLTVNAGTLDYSNGIPPSCDYTVTGGTLIINRNTSIGAFQITGGVVSGTGTLTSNTAYDLQNGTVNVGLGGNVGLNKSGPGTVSLTKSLPGGNYTISEGTLNINALSKSIGSFQITGGEVSGTGTLTSSTAYDLQNGTVDVTLGGNVGLNKTQEGVVTLKSLNTYTGDTQIVAGTLALAENGQINSLSAINNDGTFLIADGSVSHTVGEITGAGSVVLSDHAQLTVSGMVQGALVIGNNAKLTIAPPPEEQGGGVGLAAGCVTPVPEPDTWFLLVSLGTVLAVAYFRKKGQAFSVNQQDASS
jgi:fibronectin-binding autotransporter adhesin